LRLRRLPDPRAATSGRIPAAFGADATHSMPHESLKRAEGEDRLSWKNRIAKVRCDEFARRHGLLLCEADGVVHAEVDGQRWVLHQAVDPRLVWAEAYHVLIAPVCPVVSSALAPAKPSPKPTETGKMTREDRRSAQVAAFLRQYARKSHAGQDPNDRRYSREIERMVKRMRPEDFDALLHGPDFDEAEI
jgi:hypothetical protein